MRLTSSKCVGSIPIVAALAAGAFAGRGVDAVAVGEKERVALRQLHRDAVEIFVDRPGFGIRRLVMNVDDLVGELKSQSEGAGPVAVAAKTPPHFAVTDLLTGGARRFPTDVGEATWQVRTVHLVGLVTKDKPVVYLADAHPKSRAADTKPKEKADIPTREPDSFEKDALEAIRGGELLKSEKTDKAIRSLAPITAGQRCVACHERGKLLGAFSYELERVAYDPAKDGERPKRR